MAPSPAASTTGRPRSSSTTSRASTSTSFASPLARRSTRPPLGLSPIGSYVSHSASNATSSRYHAFSTAASNFGGSQATLPTITAGGGSSASPGGIARFKRAHIRNKNAPAGVRTGAHPDEVDLSILEDPDEVFRLFGVRDVRGLEKRASEAAAAKVAELRTMVGERYRDLLSAADSIVRMRTASDKLVEHMERVEAVVGGVNESVDNTPSKRGAPIVRQQRRTTEPSRTLESPPTLSLTIHLLLSLPSIVHSLLDSTSLLPAARLEAIGRVVYRELSSFTHSDDDEEGSLLDAFPIVERQWESISSLGSLIVRRATDELQSWDRPSSVTASALATIFVLDDGSLPDSLSQLLQARSETLSIALEAPSHRTRSGKPVHEIDDVVANLRDVLGLVLKTVVAASEIFDTTDGRDGVLVQLLREIENPTATTSDDLDVPRLAPILTRLPNYPLLARHLPSSIISFTPFLSISSPRNTLSSSSARSAIQSWLDVATTRVVDGVTEWISDLRGGARTLASVRAAVQSSLKDAGTVGLSLQQRLEAVVESRLEAVYASHLAAVVLRVEPCLTALLAGLPTSVADMDPAKFLFDTPLVFPPPSHYLHPSRTATAVDPFDGFLDRVMKRVMGRSPLLDRGISELEAHARDLKEDLAGWLGGEEADSDARARLRDKYTVSSRQTFHDVHQALVKVLESVTTDVTKSLFLGNFVFALSLSKTFATDLSMGFSADLLKKDSDFLATWQDGLKHLQAMSLLRWRAEAVGAAVKEIESSVSEVTSQLPSPEAPSLLPSQPSAGVLSALQLLVAALRRVGPHRVQAEPHIATSLLIDFQEQCLVVSKRLVETVEGYEAGKRERIALQLSWDIAFLRRFWPKSPAGEWKSVENSLLELAGKSDAIEMSTLQYLQRTQNIFGPLLPCPPSSTLWVPHGLPATSRLLPWGAPPAGSELKMAGGLAPGSRLGLLPTR